MAIQRRTADVLDMAALEADIHNGNVRVPRRPLDAEARDPADFAPPAVREALAKPAYTREDAGRLASEVVEQSFESAAKELEDVGGHLVEVHKQMETEAAELLGVIEEMRACAAKYRARGEAVSKTILTCAQLTKDVREHCRLMNTKIDADVGGKE